MLCSRQSGKSTVAGALALHTALTQPRSLILLLAQGQRASSELFRDKLLPVWRALGCPLLDQAPTRLTLTLSNGSRIVSLPDSEGGIRCFSGVRLLVVDEAARVSDDLYRAVRPMLAVSKGKLLAMSTPFGRRGWFFESWTGRQPWKRVRIPASACQRISAEFLGEEREALGERWFNQEYLMGGPENDFMDVLGAVFAQSDIDAAMSQPVPSIFGDY